MLPLAIAGGIYGIVLLGYALYSLYAFHHLQEYGYSVDTTTYMIRVYLGVTILIIAITMALFVVGLA